jgi:cardiolipin synthase
LAYAEREDATRRARRFKGIQDMPDCAQIRHGTAAMFTWANVITFGRLCAVPVAFWMVLERRTAPAFWLFLAAGLSDALDGWLARRFGGNAIGAVLDPVADKALLVTMYVTLAATGALPGWLAILVVFRDLLIVGGVIALSITGHAVVIRPLAVSKANTVLQITLVAVTLLRGGFALAVPGLAPLLIALVTLTTLASGAAYVWNAARGYPTGDDGGASGPG